MINIKDQELIRKFGQRVRLLRQEKKLSQEELAHRASIELSQVGRIERGEINTTISTANTLATALDVSLKTLFDLPIKLPQQKY